MIPHIYRQELYVGKDKVIANGDASEKTEPILEPTDLNESPVNFFEPDFDNYPNFKDVERKYTVLIHEGDCLYIPAFYFH